MDISIEHIDEWEKRIGVCVPWSAVEEDYGKLLAQYAKLPVNGYRAGKIPSGVVESLFRNQLRDDLAAGCGRRLCRTALAEHGLEPASPLELSEVELQKGEKFSFRVEFLALPEFDLPDYTSLKLQMEDREAKLNEISERLLLLSALEPHGRLVEQELLYGDGDQNGGEEAEAALRRVKLMLILRRIARQEGIAVDGADVSRRIGELAAQNGITSSELEGYLRQNHGIERLSDALLAEQVLDFLIDIQH